MPYETLEIETEGAAGAARYGMVNWVLPDEELDITVDDWAARIAAKPAAALHMTCTQFRAYARATLLGDVTEGDGDLIRGAAADSSEFFGGMNERRD